MIRTGVIGLAVVIVVLGLAGTSSAETPLGTGWTLDGNVEAGVRFFIDEPSDRDRAKLFEYRDFNNGLFLNDLGLRLHTSDEKYSFELGGRQWGLDDQSFRLGAERLGLLRFEFQWDQIPHVLSTTGRTLATQPADNTYVLTLPRPPLPAHNSGRELDEIGFRTDNANLKFTLTPTPDLDLKVEYTRTWKHGDKPFGVAMSSPGGNFYEALEPVSSVTHDVRLRATWARETYQLQFDYVFSLYNNEFLGLRTDNPCFANPTCGNDGAAAAQATSQSSLPPDNMAHTFTLSGGVNLPWWRTRIYGSAGYSIRLQDDTFLPHTINPALASSPTLVLPQQSLDGHVDTYLINLGAVTRPLAPLTITGKFRFYKLDDNSDTMLFQQLVQNDRSFLEGRRTSRFGYTKYDAGVDGRWRFNQVAGVTVGAGWERWDRPEDHREAPITDEYFAKLALDVTPYDWVSGRLTYKPSFRRINEYNTGAHEHHTVLEEDPASVAQSLLLRKFDEADRNRQRVDLVVNFTPFGRISPLLETLAVSPTFSWIWDDYLNSPLGLQKAETYAIGIDLSWAPTERVSMYAGYMYENIDQDQRSRSRPVTGTTVFDFPDFDWASKNVDTVHTLWTGVRAALIPKVLDFGLWVAYSFAEGSVETTNPLTPTSGTPAQRTTATAQQWPAFETELAQIGTGLRYHFWKSWTAGLSYSFEWFRNRDWRTDDLNPFMPGTTSIFLGNRTEDYTAHIIAATLGYRF